MSKSSDRPRRRSVYKRPQVHEADRQIHDAVAECVQLATELNETPAEFVDRHIKELITQGWLPDDAEQVGARAIGVLNAMSLPATPKLRPRKRR